MHEVIIIGSGVSGGRVAAQLCEAGVSCLMLEAGEEFPTRTLPLAELDYSTRMYWGGGIELARDGRLGLLRGKCVGGTSMLNQALLDRFDDDAWDDWRARSGGIEWMSVDAMERHYAACVGSLEASYVPERHHNRNTKLFVEAFDAAGLGWSPLFRGQADCRVDDGTDCMACLGGCPRESKQSSTVTTIRRARAAGLELESACDVERIERRKGSVLVHATHRGTSRTFEARRVVLAAGALGTTSLLLRSGFADRLPALGRGFTCHPQYMAFGVFDEPVDAHKGAFQAVKSDDPTLRRAGLKIENVFAPPIGTSMLLPGHGSEHRRLMRRYRHLASMEVAIRDVEHGTLRVDKRGRMQIDKQVVGQDARRAQHGIDTIMGLLSSVGATETIACTAPIGLHLMGGCTIGTDPRSSVVSPDLTLHDMPEVCVADSSVFPGAPGINPSFTIMALAHRLAEGMLA